MAVDGPAAMALGDLARERWRRATGEKVQPAASADPDLWPADLTPLLRDVDIGIARTQPRYRGEPGIREI
ncbi:hypothetical protein QIG52_26625, partial [Klebsiella pneumoniae]|nr:hypothetical protein [Klebsiella pneumoniae]